MERGGGRHRLYDKPEGLDDGGERLDSGGAMSGGGAASPVTNLRGWMMEVSAWTVVEH
jgi:hypothetical protein